MRKLRITWDDDETGRRVRDDIIPRAEADLRWRLGIPDSANFSFVDPGPENTLLENRCWYDFYDQLEDFYANYAEMIAQVRHKWEVIQYAEEQAQA